MSIGERLKVQRERVGLTQGQVAEYEGISKTYLSALERGANQPNVWPLLVKLSRRYRCSTDYLLELTDDPLGSIKDEPEETKMPRIVAELLDVYQQLSPQQQDTLLSIAKVLKAADEPRVIGA